MNWHEPHRPRLPRGHFEATRLARSARNHAAMLASRNAAGSWRSPYLDERGLIGNVIVTVCPVVGSKMVILPPVPIRSRRAGNRSARGRALSRDGEKTHTPQD